RERSAPAGGREVCRQPVFAAGAGGTHQSLIGAGNSLIAENNYGYSGPLATEGGATTSPGLARVDLQIQSVKAKKKRKKHRKGKHHRRKHSKASAGKLKHPKKKKKRKKKKVKTAEKVSCHLTWTSD